MSGTKTFVPFPGTQCLYLCYITNPYLSLVCGANLCSCHFRDEASLGESFKVTQLQNKS